MRKFLFLVLFAFMLTGCYSINDSCNYSNSVWLLKLANSSHIIIDESCIEMYHVDLMPGNTPHFHSILLNDAGSERWHSFFSTWNETLLGEEFSIIFRDKELYKGIFVCTPSLLYDKCYTIDFALAPPILVLETGPNTPNLVDRRDEDELFAYFDSVGKLQVTH